MDELDLVEDASWDSLIDVEGRRKIDAGVRLVASLLDTFDAGALYLRTGMVLKDDGLLEQASCPLFIETRARERAKVLVQLVQQSHGQLQVPRLFLGDTLGHALSVVPVDVRWQDEFDPAAARRGDSFRRAIVALAKNGGVSRVSMPRPLRPSGNGSLVDIDLPADRMVQGRRLDGNGVVVGIIDDGCALAHPHFLVPGKLESRLLALWDPARDSDDGGWGPPLGDTTAFALPGRELTKAAIDGALAAHRLPDGRLDEDAVYEALGYELPRVTHGTHVMDIACGNGRSVMGTPGVACAADIVFVQLPRAQVAQGGPLLENSILQGAA